MRVFAALRHNPFCAQAHTERHLAGNGGWRALGALLLLAALWPLTEAIAAVAGKDYLAAALLGALVWVVSRTGLDLASMPARNEGP